MAKMLNKPPLAKQDKPQTTGSKQTNAVLQKLVLDLNAKFGSNAVKIGVPKSPSGENFIERITTGSFSLDVALGGGIPVGRFIEFSGALSSTKTTQAMHIVSNAQKKGYVCAMLDIENTSDDIYREKLVDNASLLYSNPDGMEEACQMILDMQRSGIVHLAVLDSIAALCPNKEQDTAMEDTVRMGIPQQMLGEFLRKFQANNNRLSRENKRPFTLIGINQLREKIGSYGDPEYSPGGRAKGFFASVDVRFRRGDWITEGKGDNKDFVGQVVKFKIEKNKTFRRMQTGEFDFYFAKNNAGVKEFHNDYLKEIVICGVEWGVIERAGAWFKYKDNKYQGMEALISAMREGDFVEDIKKDVLFLSNRKDD